MSHRTRYVPGLVVTMTLLCGSGWTAEYFFDSRVGSDANLGTTPDAPMQSLQKLSALQLGPGDTVRLRRGRTFRGQLSFQGNGTPHKPIRICAYGDGCKPEILASVQVRDWQKGEEDVYSATLPTGPGYDRDLFSIYEYNADRVPVRLLRSRDALPREPGHFHFDPKQRVIHIVTSNGRPPGEHRIEVPVYEQICDLRDREWIEIEEITLLFGNRRHIVIHEAEHVVIRRCASMFVGRYGNPNIILKQASQVEILDCFLYENINCGILLTDGTTRCRVAGCTIVKCASNDGVTLHSGGRDKNGVRQGITGDFNVVENNVIGLCPEESIDITSGDYHLIQGNICYGNGNPGIIVGHDSDHILIRNNISFNNVRAGIQVGGNPDEGSRGENVVVRNLVYGNGYPGLEIQAPGTMVLNNTVLDSTERVAVRLSPKARGSHLYNNVIVTTSPVIRHASVQFMLGSPGSYDVAMDHNLFFHAARPDGRVIQTVDGNMTLAEAAGRYGVSRHSRIADPHFVPADTVTAVLAPHSPGVDQGIDAGQGRWGPRPDLGWKEAGDRASLPPYPAALITGENDEDVVLWLWGKAPLPAQRPRPPFAGSDPLEAAETALAEARNHEQNRDLLQAWCWYQAALFWMREDDPRSRVIRNRIAEFAADETNLHAARELSARHALDRATYFLALEKKRWVLIAHYLQVAATSAATDSDARKQANALLGQHKAEVTPHLAGH